jgi:hypothetical protein
MLASQMASFLVANRTRVVYEKIDGETILIHLGTGTYYSLDGAGSEAWEMVARGSTREALLAAGRERCAADPLAVEMGLSGLIEELLREELGRARLAPGAGNRPAASLRPGAIRRARPPGVHRHAGVHARRPDPRRRRRRGLAARRCRLNSGLSLL